MMSVCLSDAADLLYLSQIRLGCRRSGNRPARRVSWARSLSEETLMEFKPTGPLPHPDGGSSSIQVKQNHREPLGLYHRFWKMGVGGP